MPKDTDIEAYKIPHAGCFQICKGQFARPDAPGFHVMHDGCGIARDIQSMEDGRRVIHEHALSDLIVREKRLTEDLAVIRSAYVKLKKDSWNLSLFMTKHQEESSTRNQGE